MSQKTLSHIFFVVVALGLADALYLSMTVLLGVAPTCGPLHGCSTVAESSYSRWFGIPIAYLGALFFFGASILGTYLTESRAAQKLAVAYTALGLCVALWSLYTMKVLIGAWCVYCLGIDAALILLFILSIALVRKGSATI